MTNKIDWKKVRQITVTRRTTATGGKIVYPGDVLGIPADITLESARYLVVLNKAVAGCDEKIVQANKALKAAKA